MTISMRNYATAVAEGASLSTVMWHAAPGVVRTMPNRSTLNKPADEAVDLRIGVGEHLPSH